MTAENDSNGNLDQGLSDLNDRDFAGVLLPDLDYEAQLLAIRNLLGHHKYSDKALREQILQLEQHARQTKGVYGEHLVNEWVDHIHKSIYQDAAHSMAAVGMLAPLMESIFYQSFHATRHHLSTLVNPGDNHQRWQQSVEDQWDCHFVWNNGRRSKNLVEGILQLAEAIKLSPYLPSDLKFVLQALFEYRNKMFHCGFEWPIEERQRFAMRIDGSRWPADWFTKATKGGEPWIFYFTDTFTMHCIDVIDNILEGLGAFVREKLSRDDD